MTQADAHQARVVFVGVATLDAIALVNGFPGPDQRMVADDVAFAGGGPAATAAVAASRLGLAAAFVGAVGDDADGERIVADLASEGVDVSGVVRVPGTRSGASVVVADRTHGTRAICNRPAPSLRSALPEGAVRKVLRDADWVHADQAGWEVVRDLAGASSSGRPKFSLDAGNPIPGLDPRGIDLLVPTYDTLAADYPDAPDPLVAALDAGALCVVATRGSGGAVAATADGRRADVDGLRVPVLSTLGAGDVFHGALVRAAALDMPLGDQLAYANAVAAMSCAGLDGRRAIPTHDAVLAFLRDHHDHPTQTKEPAL